MRQNKLNFGNTNVESPTHVFEKKVYLVRFNESPLQMMKSVLCFILKALFALKIYDFLTF